MLDVIQSKMGSLLTGQPVVCELSDVRNYMDTLLVVKVVNPGFFVIPFLFS